MLCVLKRTASAGSNMVRILSDPHSGTFCVRYLTSQSSASFHKEAEIADCWCIIHHSAVLMTTVCEGVCAEGRHRHVTCVMLTEVRYAVQEAKGVGRRKRQRNSVLRSSSLCT
ncbi:hypothetical protein TRVL_00420 [Trypanosoma vivax]|uniref:Uncharacterized protein n=1 Tax=Trypanosoma vivax (strain Y486) TaxID=1055687 RepID=G0U7U1_TRYVY|nr:hypothetical protein TRVL_00420 [Trypanosoma vivax]CCC51949.1 hypothetical protein TVY486_1009940 [Trypanosoma vivax Y486]